MGEPARKLEDEPEQAYLRALPGGQDSGSGGEESGGEEGGDRPNLTSVEGGGETTARSRGHLKAVKDGEESGATQEATRGDSGEKPWEVNTDEGGGRGGNKSSRRKILARRYAGGSLLGGGVVGLTMLALSSLVPLKINHIIENVEDHYNAGINDATDNMREKLMSRYLRKHVLPNLGGTCTSTIDRNCRFRTDWDERSAFGRLGAAWQDDHFEQKLAEGKYGNGVEFMREGRNSAEYRVRVRGQPDLTFDMGTIHTDGDLVDVMGRRPAVRRAVKKATEDLTLFKRAYARYRIGTLLERKYGIDRCHMGCDRRDGLARLRNDLGNKKRMHIISFTNKVIEPHSQVGAALIACIVSEGCEDPDSFNGDGERRDKFQREVQEKLQELAEEIGEKTVRELVESADSILKNGVTGHVIGKIMTIVFNKEVGDQAARVAAKAIPIVGWVDTVADLLHKLDSVPRWLRKARFVAISGLMVAQYMHYRSVADEEKAGMVDADMFGGFVDSLGTSQEGSIQAEASPVYEMLVPSQPATAALAPFTQRASAQARVKVITCNDGSTLGSRKICPEEDLDTNDGVTNMLDFLTNNPAVDAFQSLSGLWYQDFIPGPTDLSLNSIWGAKDELAGVLTNNPLARPIVNRIESIGAAVFDPIMDFVASRLIGSPFYDDIQKLATDGVKNFVTLVGGVGVTAFTAGQYEMGGRYASAAEIGKIRREQEQERLAEFAALPLKDRLFDTSTRYSLVSQVAMALPANTSTGVFQSLAQNLSNPFVSIGSIFGSLFSATPVGAQNRQDIECDDPSPYSGCDPYHLPSMIFPKAEMTADPEELTDDACRTINEEWQGSVDEEETDKRIVNPENGMDLYKETNECKLVCGTTTGLGAVSDKKTITQEEKGQCGAPDNESAATPTGPVGAACPSGINPQPHPSQANYFRMPPAPNGEYAIYSVDARQYGSKTLVCTLYNVGIAFNTATHGQSKLQIGDLNGGSPHKSHYRGIAVDVDGQGAKVAADHNFSNYDTETTITLGKIFIDTGIIRNIWWCDYGDGSTQAIIDYANRPGGPGFEGQIKCLDGHHNHFHVDIQIGYAVPGSWKP